MNYLSIPHYRGLKEKYSESLHGDGLYFTTDTHEIIANNASHGDNIASWDLHDGVLTLTMKSGAQQIVNFTEASETEKGLLSAADKKQLNNLQDNLDSKVDKVTGKSLILDSEIEKLAGLPNSTELTNSIANAKAAGDNAQSDLDAHKLNVSNPHQVTKAQLGLGNVTNDAQVKRSEMGVAGGVATLDGIGKVPAAQLPVYVDDVLEGTLINATTFQLAEGQQGGVQLPNVIYVDTTTNKSYRWSGTQYVTIASDLALGETSSTAYPGDKGKAATDNINKVKSTALSHIDDTTPVTYSASKVTVNYECYEGDQYGSAGTKHWADIAAASSSVAGVMSASDKTKLDAFEEAEQYTKATNLPDSVISNADVSSDANNVTLKYTKDSLIDGSNSEVNLQIPAATTSAAGVMTAGDKFKMSTLPALVIGSHSKNWASLIGIIQHESYIGITQKLFTIGEYNEREVTSKILAATTSTAGVMSSSDKVKLDGIKAGAQVNKIESVSVNGTPLEITNKGVDIPNATTEKDGMMSANDKSKLDYLANEETLAYGVEWDTTSSDPHLTRIGNMSLHKTLPIQSQLKGCIAQKDKVIYWLNESDWRFRKEAITKSVELTVAGDVYTIVADIFNTLQYDKQWVKVNGVACQISSINTSTNTATLLVNDDLKALSLQSGTKSIELGAVLNGYDGTVRVYCPNFYIKSVIDGTKRRVWISTIKIDNSYTHQPEILIDAYRSTVLIDPKPTNMGYLSTLPVTSAISVVNTHDYCRGGGNRSEYDAYLETDPSRSDLCKPRTDMARRIMRTFSRYAGSEMLSYDQYKNIFYWLYVIEYANFNCQEAYNEAVTAEGYKQGGLGDGVTTINNNHWKYYNNIGPLTPCGYCNELGNGTGLKTMTVVTPTTSGGDPTQTYNFSVPRWRGFDNPFGDIWTNLDGIIIQGDTKGNPKTVYTTTDPNNYGDDESAMNAMEIAGHEIHQNGYTNEFDLGEAAHIIPESGGGDATKHKCDGHQPGNKDNFLKTLLVGCGADAGALAGLGYFNSANNTQHSFWHIGFRSVSTFVSFSE